MSHVYFNAYRFIAASVSPFVNQAELYKSHLEKQDHDWEVIAKIAGHHCIVQALYPCLLNKELIQHLPDDFASYLKSTYEVNLERNTLMQKQLFAVVSILNSAGIQPLLMKGAAHLCINTFTTIGDRLLTDLDILVNAEQLELAQHTMLRDGYEFKTDDPEFHAQHIHLPPAIKLGECSSVEVHRDLLRRQHQKFLPTTLAWANSVDITLPNNTQAKILNPTYRIMHSFLHDYVTDSLYKQGFVELRTLHELTQTYLKHDTAIDWGELFDQTKITGISHMLASYIHSAKKFMNLPDIANAHKKHALKTAYHHGRVCAKLKYPWFDFIDTKISVRIVEHQEKLMR